VKRTKLISTILAVIFILSVTAFADGVFYTPDEKDSIEAAVNSFPEMSAESYIVVDALTGDVLFEQNSTTALPIASITKMMTALVVVESSDLSRVVVVDAESCGIEGSSVNLYKGEKISIQDLLYALMLESANDAAVCLARAVSGSVEAFATLMNEKAEALGMKNSLWALILPGAISTHNMLVTRTAFANIPDSLEESAKLDGAGHWRIMIQIFLPLIKPTLAVITLYYVVAHWNSWFSAAIYIRDRAKYPLQLVLRNILIDGDMTSMTAGVVELGEDMAAISDTIKYAITMISTLPILLVYPFVQKYFVKGVMVGAIKG